MTRLRLALSLAVALVFALATLSVPVAEAQTSGSSSSSSSSSSGTASTGTPWGTRMEHWLAAGLGLTLGAASVATGTGLSRYALDLNGHALLPSTTQADAAASANTARDFMLAADVLWVVGASLAGIALTWIIVLSFSTPAPSTAPEAAATPSAALRITPLGVTFEGVF